MKNFFSKFLNGKNSTDIVEVDINTLDLSREVFILDVREPSELREAKIPGVYEIPLGDLARRYTELPKDETIYIVCRSGNRSKKASQFLAEKGYDCVNLSGGMKAYRGEIV